MQSPAAPSFDTRLEEVLVTEGRKQTWLSERTAINPTRLNHIVHGLRPSESEASAIALALGRTIADLGWAENAA